MLDLDGIIVGGESEPATQPPNMGVDREPRGVERH
jgi:hypothetical protein